MAWLEQDRMAGSAMKTLEPKFGAALPVLAAAAVVENVTTKPVPPSPSINARRVWFKAGLPKIYSGTVAAWSGPDPVARPG